MASFLKPGISPDPVSESPPYIPRKIWQTTKDRNGLPPLLRRCVDQLQETNPGWEYTLFDDETQLAFLQKVGSERLLKAYDRISPRFGAMRADFFRYVIMYLHGGAYLDIKSGTTRPLDEILLPTDRFIYSQWDNEPGGEFEGVGLPRGLRDIPGGEYEQWYVIAQPGHPYLMAVIEQMLHNFETYRATRYSHGRTGIFNLCGPSVYTRVIHAHKKEGLHRKIYSWREGIRYTMLDNLHAHQTSTHYGRFVTRPLTSKHLSGPDLIGYWISEMLQWPLSRVRHLNYKRLDRRRAKSEKHKEKSVVPMGLK